MKRIFNALMIFATLLSIVGCSQSNPSKIAFDATEQEQKEADLLSARWKKEHRIDDFHSLKDRYLKPGAKSTRVVELLGDPLNKSETDNGTKYWLYIRCNAQQEQYYAWTCIIGSDGKVIRWKKKGIK